MPFYLNLLIFSDIIFKEVHMKLLHAADIHLGAKNSKLPLDMQNLLRSEQVLQIRELFSHADENGYDAQTVDEIMTAKDASGETLGYAFTITSSEGYGGDIQFAMGVQNDGTLNGISILSIEETAGLGMKADTDEFKDQFKDKQVEMFSYTKNGEEGDDKIDAISGATITTNAVTNAVNSALVYYQNELGGGVNE